MIGLLQRVSQANVRIDAREIAAIGQGIVVLVAIEKGDTASEVVRLANKICGYRVFSDADGKMNVSVTAQGGGILLVPQFTLAANTDKGMRASFAAAAEPAMGMRLYQELCDQVRVRHDSVQSGVFGADMAVSLTNDGPVTFWLRAAAPA